MLQILIRLQLSGPHIPLSHQPHVLCSGILYPTYIPVGPLFAPTIVLCNTSVDLWN